MFYNKYLYLCAGDHQDLEIDIFDLHNFFFWPNLVSFDAIPEWNIIYIYNNIYMICAQVIIKAVHLVSLMGNKGTFTKSYQQIITDTELLYNVAYFVCCVVGLFVPYAYSILVSFLKFKL